MVFLSVLHKCKGSFFMPSAQEAPQVSGMCVHGKVSQSLIFYQLEISISDIFTSLVVISVAAFCSILLFWFQLTSVQVLYILLRFSTYCCCDHLPQSFAVFYGVCCCRLLRSVRRV